jgi:hypothetical protein
VLTPDDADRRRQRKEKHPALVLMMISSTFWLLKNVTKL